MNTSMLVSLVANWDNSECQGIPVSLAAWRRRFRVYYNRADAAAESEYIEWFMNVELIYPIKDMNRTGDAAHSGSWVRSMERRCYSG
jgi:hypothetical protein